MRQAPKDYLIIGHGRVARHFEFYLTSLGLDVALWHRAMPVHDMGDARRILVLISDRAIEDFIQHHLTGKSGVIVHFSGALVSDAAFGAHPLMTFNEGLYDASVYPAIPFVVDDNAPDDLLPGLPNPIVKLSREHKAKYHAMCCMAANHSCLLWQKLFKTFEDEFGLPPETAHQLLKQQTQNLVADYKTALTGPLSRGDAPTLQKHLQALQGDAYLEVYQSFITAYEREKS